MPGGDRTGPMGMGARTGRGTGFCSGSGMPGFMSRGFGMGFGRGRGGGRGWRNMFYGTGLPGTMRFGGNSFPAGNPVTNQKIESEMEIQALKEQAEVLRLELDSINHRLSEIGTGNVPK